MVGASSVCLAIEPETATTSIAATAQITETITVAVIAPTTKALPQALDILPLPARGGAASLVSSEDRITNQDGSAGSNAVSGRTTLVVLLNSAGQIPQAKTVKIAFSLGSLNSSATNYSVKAQPLVDSKGNSIAINASIEKTSCEGGSCKIAVTIGFPAGVKIKPGYYQGKISLVINNN
jgi:hypothetical protein